MPKKEKSNQPPKTQAERRREFQKSRFYNSPLTPEGEIRLGIYVNNLWSYRRLIRFGLYNFDSQGRVFIEHAEDQKQEMISGRDFLVELIQYFEKKDEPYAYLYCANLKELLDEYNQKFHA